MSYFEKVKARILRSDNWLSLDYQSPRFGTSIKDLPKRLICSEEKTNELDFGKGHEGKIMFMFNRTVVPLTDDEARDLYQIATNHIVFIDLEKNKLALKDL